MPHAEIRIRREPYYRLDAITQGMKRLGFEIVPHARPAPGNVLVLWNRKAGRDDTDATAMEAAGGKVLVIENGYLQKVDKTMYAVSLSEHHTGGPVATPTASARWGSSCGTKRRRRSALCWCAGSGASVLRRWRALRSGPRSTPRAYGGAG